MSKPSASPAELAPRLAWSSRRVGRLALAALVLVPAAARAQLDLAGWLEQLDEPFHRSPRSVGLVEAIDSARGSAQAARGESPFTLRAQVDGRGFQQLAGMTDPTDPLYDPFRRDYGGRGSAGLEYRSRLGLDVRLGAQGAYDRYLLADLPPRNPDWPYAGTLDVSYDVLRGGGEGLERSRALASSLRAESRLYDLHRQLLDARLEYARLLIDLFVSHCKISELQKARGEVARTVAEGKVKVDTKTISYKDYLNFLELESSFARRNAGLEALKAAQVQRLLAWSPELPDASGKLSTGPLACQPQLEPARQRARRATPAPELRGGLASALPSYLSASASRRAAELELRVVELSLGPSVGPFVAASFGQSALGRRPLGDLSAGVAASWNLPGARGELEVEAARRSVRSAARLLEATRMASLAQLNALAAEIEAQERSYEVLTKSLQNSRELLRTLEAQRAIGMVDSLSYTSAYLNSIDSRFAVLDSLAAIEKATFELNLYNGWAARAPTSD